VRVVIGEDETLLRHGLTLVLERAGFEVAALAADADELVRKAVAQRPDLVVTDIRMPPGNADDGLRAALAIRARHPEVAVLVLSHHLQRRYATELLDRRNGAAGVGYLLKQRITDVEAFCTDVRRVYEGASVLDPEIVTMLLKPRSEDGPVARLTPRQVEVLELMAQERSNAAIAERLVITEKAVVGHISRIYDVLDLPPQPTGPSPRARRAAALLSLTFGTGESSSAPERIRTSDLRFRRPTLYPAELRAHGQRLSSVAPASGEGGIRTRDGDCLPILA
jgi:DNA-binding NarL/FixJ family response regulator